MKGNAQRNFAIFDLIFLMIIFTALFWICNIYPRHILELNSWYSILAVLLNLVFHGALAFFLVYYKEKTINPAISFKARFSFEAKPLLKRFSQILLLQLLIDLLNLLFGRYLAGYFFLLSNLLTFTFWLITHRILEGRGAKVNRRQIILLLLAALGLSLCLFFDFNAAAEQQSLLQKITTDQVGWTQVFDNFKFEHGFRNFLLDTFLGALFLTDIALQRTYSNQIRAAKLLARSFSRSALLVLALCICALIKMLLSPNDMLAKISQPYSETKTYREEKEFFINTDEKKVYRMNELRQYECNYYKTKYTVSYGNKDSLNKIDAFFLYESESDVEERPMKNQTSQYDINDISVEIYCNWAICYAINEQPMVIHFDKINHQPENELLIETCKKMIEDGNIIAFEYAAEYLNRYDPDFVAEYTNRYANADFNYIEEQYIADYEYREEYLVSFARKLIGNDENITS